MLYLSSIDKICLIREDCCKEVPLVKNVFLGRTILAWLKAQRSREIWAERGFPLSQSLKRDPIGPA